MKKMLAVCTAFALLSALALPVSAKASTQAQKDAYAAQVRVYSGAQKGRITVNRLPLTPAVTEFLGEKINLLTPVDVIASLFRMNLHRCLYIAEFGVHCRVVVKDYLHHRKRGIEKQLCRH